MKEIKNNSELEVGKYYHCFLRSGNTHSINKCMQNAPDEPKFIGNNRIWAETSNNQALTRWKMIGPITIPTTEDNLTSESVDHYEILDDYVLACERYTKLVYEDNAVVHIAKILKGTDFSEDEDMYIVACTDVLGEAETKKFIALKDKPKGVNSEEAPPYKIRREADRTLNEAKLILINRLKVKDNSLSSPEETKLFLKLHFEGKEHEVFTALWLDQKHRVIEVQDIFRGTIDGASVHPREVVKDALKVNAAAVIFAHNHPSGSDEPSRGDINITKRLKDALDLVDINVLDHMVVGDEVVSFAERGLI